MTETANNGLLARQTLWLARQVLRALPADVSHSRRDEVLHTLSFVLRDHEQERRAFSMARSALGEIFGLIRFVFGAWTADLIPELKWSDRMRLFFNDVSQAARSLRRRPAYSAIAVLILSVGIGAGTAIFSVLDPVLLRADSFDQERNLVYLNQTLAHADVFLNHHPPGALALYRDADTLAGTSAYTTDTSGLFVNAEPERVHTSQIDSQLLPLLRTQPIIGRNFNKSERGEPLALISESFWRDHFANSNEVLGQTIEVDEVQHTIVGVLPSEFTFPNANTRVWRPLQKPENGWENLSTHVVARPNPKVSLETATDELTSLISNLDQQLPVSGEVALRLHTKDGTDAVTKTTLWTLFGGVGILLLTACANAANLAMTQTTGRKAELSIRRALGASRTRLTQQLLYESGLLALTAAVFGYCLAQGTVPWLLRLAPDTVRLPAGKLVALDWRIMGFSLIAAFFAAALTGIFPAVRATLSVWASQQRVVGANSNQRVGTVLATAQVALAFVLLLGAGLLLRSFTSLVDVEPGFDPTDVYPTPY